MDYKTMKDIDLVEIIEKLIWNTNPDKLQQIKDGIGKERFNKLFSWALRNCFYY